MRRALTTIGTTLAGLVLLLQFETRSPLIVGDVAAMAATPTGVQAAALPATPAEQQVAATQSTQPTTPQTSSTEPSTSTSTTTSTTTTTVATPSVVDVKGPAVGTRWGTVQVEVKVENGQLVDVVSLQLPSGHRYSNYVSSVAGPMLREEALAAQSAQIHNITGATVTSQGYIRSLQAALDQAGL